MPNKTKKQTEQRGNNIKVIATCIFLMLCLVGGAYYWFNKPPPPKPQIEIKVQPLVIPQRVNGQVQYHKNIVTLIVNDAEIVNTIDKEQPRLIDAWTIVVYERFGHDQPLAGPPLKEEIRKSAESILGAGKVDGVRLTVIRNLWPR